MLRIRPPESPACCSERTCSRATAPASRSSAHRVWPGRPGVRGESCRGLGLHRPSCARRAARAAAGREPRSSAARCPRPKCPAKTAGRTEPAERMKLAEIGWPLAETVQPLAETGRRPASARKEPPRRGAPGLFSTAAGQKPPPKRGVLTADCIPAVPAQRPACGLPQDAAGNVPDLPARRRGALPCPPATGCGTPSGFATRISY